MILVNIIQKLKKNFRYIKKKINLDKVNQKFLDRVKSEGLNPIFEHFVFGEKVYLIVIEEQP